MIVEAHGFHETDNACGRQLVAFGTSQKRSLEGRNLKSDAAVLFD